MRNMDAIVLMWQFTSQVRLVVDDKAGDREGAWIGSCLFWRHWRHKLPL